MVAAHFCDKIFDRKKAMLGEWRSRTFLIFVGGPRNILEARNHWKC